MPVVNNLVDDLIDQYKVLANALLVQDTAVVTEDLHHAIDDVHDETGGHVVACRRDEVDPELLGEEVIQPLDVLKG